MVPILEIDGLLCAQVADAIALIPSHIAMAYSGRMFSTSVKDVVART
jgi:hypothetical protein